MIDRRLNYIQKLENFLLEQFPDWSGHLVLEQPPASEATTQFDLAMPCFALAKSRKMPPPAVAQQVVDKINAHQSVLGIEKAEVIKGFINIRFQAETLGAEVARRSSEPLRDSQKAWKDETVTVDYSSPNIAKPFGIGHLRSTNIGAALCRIMTSLGAKVIRINHLGDWGTQFGKMITAYKNFGSAEFVRGDPVNNLYKLYVEFHEKEKDNPGLLDEAREWFVRLEKGDAEALELWKWFRDVSYHEFKRIYDKLGVDFDYVTGESFYNELMEKTAASLKSKKLLKESEGAEIVDLEAFGMPPCLIKKSDGSTLYATRDLATAEYRAKTFKPTRLVYVVGSEQSLHFKQVFKVLELMGFEWAQKCAHVGFGLIKFPEGKMSTRKGNIILLESVLKQAVQHASEIIEEKEKTKPDERKLSDSEKESVAEMVGTGAVIFFDLHAKRLKDIMFDWKSILNFEGDSGPYLQYSTVRLTALIEKAREAGHDVDAEAQPLLKTAEERELARFLLRFPSVVEAAAREYEPSLISHELLDLAACFNRFYMNVPVLKGDEADRPGRITLIKMTRAVLVQGLQLLGIKCPQRM